MKARWPSWAIRTVRDGGSLIILMVYNRIERCTDTGRENSDVRYFYTHTFSLAELRSCVKMEVAVLGSPSLTVLMVSMGVKRR